MGNNYAVNRENLLKAEARVLSLSGLSSNEIRTYDLEIWDNCFIRTNEVGFRGNKPKLVFIHGYGGAGAVFF